MEVYITLLYFGIPFMRHCHPIIYVSKQSRCRRSIIDDTILGRRVKFSRVQFGTAEKHSGEHSYNKLSLRLGTCFGCTGSRELFYMDRSDEQGRIREHCFVI